MEPVALPVPSVSPQKRSFHEMLEPKSSSFGPEPIQYSIEPTMPSQSTPNPTLAPDNEAAMQEQQDPRHASPATSTLTSISATPTPPQLDGTPTTTTQPAKRRKLTPAEKQVREVEKAEKRARKEQEKAKKEEEKQQKDEERRQKNEEREEKKRERELEKQRKEEKKRQEDEEKQKKERAQMRMTSFFAKPRFSPKAGNDVGAASSNEDSGAVPRRRKEDETKDEENEPSQSTPSKKPISDYRKTFLPFVLPTNAVLAPHNRFTWDAEATEYARKNADTWFSNNDTESNELSGDRHPALLNSLDLSPLEVARRGFTPASTKALLERASGSQNDPVELTGSDPTRMLREIPVKYIYFHQDVRPPYVGTFSGTKSKKELRKLARNPNGRVREELEYDDDSEAEWEEPEEGEDIDSEGESEADSADGAEELDDFLDDAEAEDGQMPKKKTMVGDMKPVSSGIRWADENGNVEEDDGPTGVNLRDLRLEVISEVAKFPIDPFSTALWSWKDAHAPEAPALNALNSPRPPLQARPNIEMNRSETLKVPDPVSKANQKTTTKSLRLLTGSDLEEFKRVVEGSDLTKQGLLAIAKKRLPKVPNAALNDTLGHVARRVGSKESDKKWVLVNPDSSGS